MDTCPHSWCETSPGVCFIKKQTQKHIFSFGGKSVTPTKNVMLKQWSQSIYTMKSSLVSQCCLSTHWQPCDWQKNVVTNSTDYVEVVKINEENDPVTTN